jgi:hypothetical protein
MTVEESLAQLEREAGRIIRDSIERRLPQLSLLIISHTDEQGPPRGQRSTSKQWGSQSGRGRESLRGGGADNLLSFTSDGSLVGAEFGSSLPYLAFLEGGTSRMPALPALEPGFQDFEKDGMLPLLEDIYQQFATVFNA